MRRVLSIVTFIALIAVVMTACAGGQGAQDVSQEEEAAGGIYGGGEEVAAEAPTEAPQAPTETPPPVPTETPPEVPTEAPTLTPTETPAEVSPTEAPSEPPSSEEGNTVQVDLTEFTIDIPTTLPAGPTTFEIKNIGSFRHNFEIKGQSIEEVLATDLEAGQSDILELDLQPGTYEIICPVGNHAEQGMELELTVPES